MGGQECIPAALRLAARGIVPIVRHRRGRPPKARYHRRRSSRAPARSGRFQCSARNPPPPLVRNLPAHSAAVLFRVPVKPVLPTLFFRCPKLFYSPLRPFAFFLLRYTKSVTRVAGVHTALRESATVGACGRAIC